MEILPALRELAKVEGAPCVTLYLNTRLKQRDARERARGFVHRRIERALRALGQDPAREDLERVRAEALRRVDLSRDGDPPAVVIFSSVERGLFRVMGLEVPVEDELVVSDAPALRQLAALSDAYERTLLILVSAENARIYELVLGEVRAEQALEGEDVNTRRAPRTSPGWTQLHYQRQVREHIDRHLREVAARTAGFFDRDRPARVVVGGVQPTIDRFLHELPDRIRTRVIDVVALPPESAVTDVVHAAQESSRAEERERETAGVRQAIETALKDGPAALGLDEVLEAAREQRVMTLYLDPDLRAPGRRCTDCGTLARSGAECGFCGGRTAEVELGEALVRTAILQDAEVDFVPNSPELRRFDGLAARLRW